MSRVSMMVMVAVLLTVGAGSSAAQIHPSQLPPLTADAQFPRCTARQLATVGFPDHKHAQHWPGWEVMRDADGRTYGPESLCRYKRVIPRPDLIIRPGSKRLGPFTIEHNPGYSDCDMIQFLELLDWAGHEVPPLLGMEMPDSLLVINPDNLPAYFAAALAIGGAGLYLFIIETVTGKGRDCGPAAIGHTSHLVKCKRRDDQ